MGYYNIIFKMVKIIYLNRKKSKVDGLIVVDLPWPENKKFLKNVKKNQ